METKEKTRRVNLVKVVDYLLKQLNERERNILLKRHGLKTSKKHTLEQIGKSYKITRERVRQIEKNTIKKLKSLDDSTRLKARFHEAAEMIRGLIKQSGGIIEETHLIDQIKSNHQKINDDILGRIILFLMHHLMDDVHFLKSTDKRHSSWKVADVNEELIQEVVDSILGIIENHNEPLSDKELLAQFESTEFFKSQEEQIMDLCDLNKDGELTLHEIFLSYLRIIKKVKKNIFDKWGLTSWKNVQPRKINDKAYLVLKKHGKPLHFTEITNLINKAEFDSKVACPATVHNELILNDQYVLVGRGIYALKEWGYKEGTVIDVIYNVLEKADGPMEKDDIVAEVLKTRMVKKSTIYLSLLNKNKFKKVGHNQYTIRTEV